MRFLSHPIFFIFSMVLVPGNEVARSKRVFSSKKNGIMFSKEAAEGRKGVLGIIATQQDAPKLSGLK